ncbi:hypothetical protein HOLleu_02973 [Holothuria leucospilota]|uniref:Uncharacterized protein n=1 Tax=Holothuria leucospilota TaxID=206669 RepID=A0A9Q1HLL8_HOLLE|nr:hypothetical protein HOLleu_02973 [Holothuria leucospilota]
MTDQCCTFLWCDHNCTNEPDVYEFCRLVFGIDACPFIAQKVAKINAEKNKNKWPLASETVQLSTYMDDSMDSVEKGKR